MITTLTLTPAQHAQITRLCTETGHTRDQVINDLIRDGLAYQALAPILKQMSATLIAIADNNARRDQQMELAVKVIQDLVEGDHTLFTKGKG